MAVEELVDRNVGALVEMVHFLVGEGSNRPNLFRARAADASTWSARPAREHPVQVRDLSTYDTLLGPDLIEPTAVEGGVG
jgi:hypothetical protein